MKKGRCDADQRPGTTTLLAALEVLQGRGIGPCDERQRHQALWHFLRRLAQEFPGAAPVPVVRDHSGTHPHPPVHAGLTRHARVRPPVVPTRSRGRHRIERGGGARTSNRVRRGSFERVKAVHGAMTEGMAVWQETPRPFVGTATGEFLEPRLARCRHSLEQSPPGGTAPGHRNKKTYPSS